MMKILALLIISINCWANFQDASRLYSGGLNSLSDKKNFLAALSNEGLYFSSVAFAKQLLEKHNVDSSVDEVLEDIIAKVGVKQFEILSFNTLGKSNSATINYLLAKKYFRKGDYTQALTLIKRVPSDHNLYPFALLIEGSIHSIQKNYDQAISVFKECTSTSTSSTDDRKERQLEINQDYCLVGVARAQYAKGLFKEAQSQYQDLPKASFVWPEILFEEAWTSYNLNEFNRTLGKLVTYRSPFLDFIFNPEVDVLVALTYLKMCLFGDARATVDRFYKVYQDDSKAVRDYLNRHSKDYEFYYRQSVEAKRGLVLENNLLTKFIKSIVFEGTFQELLSNYQSAQEELARLKTYPNGPLTGRLIKNVQIFLLKQRNIMGSYIRRKLVLKYTQIYKSFIQMSNIKLEVLSQRKIDLYRNDPNQSRERGDIQYLKRNEKQYFWSFNGEFWADELGDYVFALATECR